jgi:rRNA maturation RNase YbeY
MNNRVSVYGLVRRPRLCRTVQKIAQAVLRHFRLRSKTLDIIFLSNKEMVVLKRRYLHTAGPANTLSFSSPNDDFPHPNEPREILGEVLINADLTRYQISAITPLLIHSILHLLGYHHKQERDKIKMDRLALRVSRALKR